MTFGEALEAMKGGRSVTRGSWSSPDRWLRLMASPHDGSDTSMPYVCLFTQRPVVNETPPYKVGSHAVAPAIVPWVAGHADLLAADWELMIGDG